MMKVIGFDNQKKFLIKNYLNNKLPHSIILSGDKGIGKKTFIIDFFASIFNELFDNNNLKQHLNLIKNNTHPNIKYISNLVDKKTNKTKSQITIDQIRQLNSFLNETSVYENISKFLIIDNADSLNVSASNSLLKNLEEPKKNTYFFLIVHKLSYLLPTIRSRCLKLRFNKHDFNTFKLIITKQLNIVNENEILFLYDLSNGSPGIAINIYDEELVGFYDQILFFFDQNKIYHADQINFSKKISLYDDEKFKIFLFVLKNILINIIKIKVNINFNYNTNNKYDKKLTNISSYISKNSLFNKFEYLIKNENDLFTYNLDKNLFMLNFFSK